MTSVTLHVKHRLSSRPRLAAMTPPIPIPSQSPATPDHSARQVTRPGGHAPSCRPRTASAALRPAGHGRASDQNMSLPGNTGWSAEQLHQGIARLFSRSTRAGMVWPAGAVHFTRCDTRQANARSFGAPDRAVAIPNTGWCTREGFACAKSDKANLSAVELKMYREADLTIRLTLETGSENRHPGRLRLPHCV